MKQVLTLFLMVFSLSSYAQDLNSKKSVEQFVGKVMATAGSGKTVDALMMLKPHVQIPETEFDMSLKMQESQQAIIKERFGEVLGAELINIDSVGKSLMHAVFIQKFEKHLMTWNLYFYKPKDTWIINNYNTSDKAQTLFEH